MSWPGVVPAMMRLAGNTTADTATFAMHEREYREYVRGYEVRRTDDRRRAVSRKRTGSDRRGAGLPQGTDRRRRRTLLGQLLTVSRRPHAGPQRGFQSAQIPARPTRPLRQFGDPRQEPDAAVGRFLQAGSARGAVGLRHGGGAITRDLATLFR